MDEKSQKLTIFQTLKKGTFCRKPVVCFKSLMFSSPVYLEDEMYKYYRPNSGVGAPIKISNGASINSSRGTFSPLSIWFENKQRTFF